MFSFTLKWFFLWENKTRKRIWRHNMHINNYVMHYYYINIRCSCRYVCNTKTFSVIGQIWCEIGCYILCNTLVVFVCLFKTFECWRIITLKFDRFYRFKILRKCLKWQRLLRNVSDNVNYKHISHFLHE